MKQPEQNTGGNARVTDHEFLKLASLAVSTASDLGPVSVDPDVADAMGAIDEQALSFDDALDSHFDGEDPTAIEEVKGHG